MGRNKKHSDKDTVFEIYRRMYREAEPPADFDELLESGVTSNHWWFGDYFLENDRQYEIIEEVLKEHKVPKWKWKYFRFEIILGASPTSTKKENPQTLD
jgi:hypothetical protein